MEEQIRMSLLMVPLAEGLTKAQIAKVLKRLPDNATLMPIEFHANNTSAYGFITSECYEELDYQAENLAAYIEPILEDIKLQRSDDIYPVYDWYFWMGEE